MLKLIKYLKGYTLQCIIGPLFKLLEACMELIVPVVMAKIIDVGIQNRDIQYVWRMCLVLVLFAVVGLICSLTAQYFAAKASMGFGTALRSDMFRHILSLSHADIDKIGTESLITRITSDINQAQSGVNLVLRLFLRSPFIVIGAIIMAFLIDVKLTIIFLAATLLISLIIYFIMHVTVPMYKKIQARLDTVNLLTRENLSGVRVVRAFSRQGQELSEFENASEQLMHHQVFAGRISNILNPATFVCANLAIVVILWQGGYSVNIGSITQGQLIALVNYMSQILLALIALMNLIVAFTKATASAARIQEVFDVKCSLEDNGLNELKVSNAAVKFENVCFRYAGAADNVLSDISFSVKAGQTIGIIGGTGSGKSTLINLISRYYDTTHGHVLVDNKDVKDFKLENLRSAIGVVPQRAMLFKGTIRENMLFSNANASDEQINKALTVAQAMEFVSKLPKGLDTKISQGGKNLSGGQRQRLTIARALVRNPKILILDDSASALDFATDARLRKSIRENSNCMTVFIVSQRAANIKNADMIIVLDDGCITGMGSHDQLFESCEVYREICLSQMEGLKNEK